MGKKRDVKQGGVDLVDSVDVVDGVDDGGENLIETACAAYGINPDEDLLGCRESNGVVTLVTVGGAKVLWQPGMKITPLSAVAITGINPANARRKPITGGKR